MVTLIYRPRLDGQYMAPELVPGSELVVTAVEAEQLLATGQFEQAGPEETEPSTKRRKTT